jgi:two-component system response regulator HupR/HoxA
VSETLLIIDDEPLNRDLLRRVFSHDYELLEAEDAKEAVTVMNEHGATIAVVLCDHLMPGRSGADLSFEIRQKWPSAVFVLLTGYEDAPEVEAAKKDGAIHEIVGKPWVAKMLREAIARAVAEHTKRKVTATAG